MDISCNTCAYKEQILRQLEEHSKTHTPEETKWMVDLFGPDGVMVGGQKYCCMILTLFYYALCKEISCGLSESARAIVEPLISCYRKK